MTREYNLLPTVDRVNIIDYHLKLEEILKKYREEINELMRWRAEFNLVPSSPEDEVVGFYIDTLSGGMGRDPSIWKPIAQKNRTNAHKSEVVRQRFLLDYAIKAQERTLFMIKGFADGDKDLKGDAQLMIGINYALERSAKAEYLEDRKYIDEQDPDIWRIKFKQIFLGALPEWYKAIQSKRQYGDKFGRQLPNPSSPRWVYLQHLEKTLPDVILAQAVASEENFPQELRKEYVDSTNLLLDTIHLQERKLFEEKMREILKYLKSEDVLLEKICSLLDKVSSLDLALAKEARKRLGKHREEHLEIFSTFERITR